MIGHKLFQNVCSIDSFEARLVPLETTFYALICPGVNAYEMHFLYNKHHNVFLHIKLHQNTYDSVRDEVIQKMANIPVISTVVTCNTCILSWV